VGTLRLRLLFPLLRSWLLGWLRLGWLWLERLWLVWTRVLRELLLRRLLPDVQHLLLTVQLVLLDV
jgi:hypothetical protein